MADQELVSSPEEVGKTGMWETPPVQLGWLALMRGLRLPFPENGSPLIRHHSVLVHKTSI